MDNSEFVRRIETEQKHRLGMSQKIISDREDVIISDPDSYGDDDELTYEAQMEINRLSESVEQYKRGYHNALEHIKQALKGEVTPLTHSNVERYYE